MTSQIKLITVALALSVASSLTYAGPTICKPGANCAAPKCRCWNDKKAPGGLEPKNTPQMVIVSYSYAMNTVNTQEYLAVLEGVKNPNKCPASATYFVQQKYSVPSAITKLAGLGQEIAMTSSSGIAPKDWQDSFHDMKEFLTNGAKIDPKKVKGTRAPDLSVGGDEQMAALTGNGLVYDASCVTKAYSTAGSRLWPYTYDFPYMTPQCTIGKAPSQSHLGIWQFLSPVKLYNNTYHCATVTGCSPFIKTYKDAFQFLYRNFMSHYNGKRTPFLLELSTQWLVIDHLKDATRQFLQYISAGFKDTYIVNYSQALDWMMDPQNTTSVKSFKPWGC